MKTLFLSILSLFIFGTISAQKDCRMEVIYGGYSVDHHVISIKNLSTCVTRYDLEDDFDHNLSVTLAAGETRTVDWKISLNCDATIKIYPNEKCNLYGKFPCDLLPVVITKDRLCSTLPVQAYNFFPTQDGNTFTGQIRLSEPPVASKTYEVRLYLQDGSKVVKSIHSASLISRGGDLYSFTIQIK